MIVFGDLVFLLFLMLHHSHVSHQCCEPLDVQHTQFKKLPETTYQANMFRVGLSDPV